LRAESKVVLSWVSQRPIHDEKPDASAAGRDAWRYFDGKGGWTDDLRKSTPVCSGNDMMPIYYNDYRERYVALYSKPLSRDAVLRTAPRPEGPWSTAL